MRDLMGIMKQAQAMQQKMQDVQAELDTIEVQGSSGGGVVTVTMTAKGQMKGVSIDRSLLKADEKEIVDVRDKADTPAAPLTDDEAALYAAPDETNDDV